MVALFCLINSIYYVNINVTQNVYLGQVNSLSGSQYTPKTCVRWTDVETIVCIVFFFFGSMVIALPLTDSMLIKG